MCVLAEAVGHPKPGGHRDTAARSAGDLYAAELYDLMTVLVANNHLPKIVVGSMNLNLVPVASLTTRGRFRLSAVSCSAAKAQLLYTISSYLDKVRYRVIFFDVFPKNESTEKLI